MSGIFTPTLIQNNSFQAAWVKAVRYLSERKWMHNNFIVHIEDPTMFDKDVHDEIAEWCKEHSLLSPRDVAYTIMPYEMYARLGSADRLYQRYMDRFYPWTRQRAKKGWGTYFQRMICYETSNGDSINQLRSIIEAIVKDKLVYRAAFTISILYPSDWARRMGAPCLNQICVQLHHNGGCKMPQLGLMCLYRNHDFAERSYGNYWGLCNLLRFLASESGLTPGPITCISSRAYVDKKKLALRKLVSKIS